MSTLTRLALGASAVSAVTVFGTALPAVAQTSYPARSATGATTTPAAPASGAAHRTTLAANHRATTARPTNHPSSTANARTSTARTSAASRAAHDAYVGRVMRAITAMRQADARAAATHSSTRASKTRPTRSTAPTARRRVTGGRTSQNWSGYTQSAAALHRPVTSISAAWQVPQARPRTRGSSGAASDWIGIGGTLTGRTADPTLIQAGATTTVGRAGTASTYTWFETLPTASVETPLSTRSGDRIRVAIDEVATDRWRVRLANVTTGHSWSTSVRYRSSGGSADFVSERPDIGGSGTALPERTATSFRHATVNGSSTRFRPSQRLTMTDGRRAVATPSGPEGRSGDGFSVCSYSTHCGAGSR